MWRVIQVKEAATTLRRPARGGSSAGRLGHPPPVPGSHRGYSRHRRRRLGLRPPGGTVSGTRWGLGPHRLMRRPSPVKFSVQCGSLIDTHKEFNLELIREWIFSIWINEIIQINKSIHGNEFKESVVSSIAIGGDFCWAQVWSIFNTMNLLIYKRNISILSWQLCWLSDGLFSEFWLIRYWLARRWVVGFSSASWFGEPIAISRWNLLRAPEGGKLPGRSGASASTAVNPRASAGDSTAGNATASSAPLSLSLFKSKRNLFLFTSGEFDPIGRPPGGWGSIPNISGNIWTMMATLATLKRWSRRVCECNQSTDDMHSWIHAFMFRQWCCVL